MEKTKCHWMKSKTGKIVKLFMLVAMVAVLITNVSLFAFAEIGSEDEHTKSDSQTGVKVRDGYSGPATYEYTLWGTVDIGDGRGEQPVEIPVKSGTVPNSNQMQGFMAWDPSSDPSLRPYMLGFNNVSNSQQELANRVASSLGVNPADILSGKISLNGLNASINYSLPLKAGGAYLQLPDGSKLSIGNNLTLTNGLGGLSPALQAIMAGASLKNAHGETVLSYKNYLSKILDNKVSTIELWTILKGLGLSDADLEKLKDKDKDKNKIPDPDPDKDKDEDGEKDLRISFNPSSCDWTNNKYHVKTSCAPPIKHHQQGSLMLNNCHECHGCGKCPHSWTTTKTVTSKDPITGKVTETEVTESHSKTTSACAVYSIGTPHFVNCDGCPDNDCGNKIECRSGNHGACSRTSDASGKTFLWWWEEGINPTVTSATCSGAVSISGIGSASADYLIGVNGSHTAKVSYSATPVSIKPSPATAAKWYSTQSWYINAKPSKSKTKSSGPYKYDDINPVVTVASGGYMATKSFSSNGSMAGDWTRETVVLTITASDSLSGVDNGKSYVRASGPHLASPDNICNFSGSASFHDGKATIAFTKTGIYTVNIHVEDWAKLGCTSAEDGIPNSVDVTVTVKIDKVEPIIKFAFDKETSVVNPATSYDRNETSPYIPSSKTPGYYIHVSDSESGYPSAGLDYAKCHMTQTTPTSSNIKELVNKAKNGKLIASSSQPAGKYKFFPVEEAFRKNGHDTYMIVYAKDKVGNETYSFEQISSATEDYKDGPIKDENDKSHNARIGDIRDWSVTDGVGYEPRKIRISRLFVNRSDLYPDDPSIPVDPNGGMGPLQIVNVKDVKWASDTLKTIKPTSPALSKRFAVYRNNINDSIGLGYRVQFRYYTIGYNTQVGDNMKMYFKLYGFHNNEYKELDLLLKKDDGSYQKVETNTNYFTREVTRGTNDTVITSPSDDTIILNGIAFQDKIGGDRDVSCIYFNYCIPATAAFNIKGTSTRYNGTEVLVCMNIVSRKFMDTNGIITYTLTKDPYVPWGTTGPQFYGTSKIVPNLDGRTRGEGEAFWYDAKNTALTDVTGNRSY